MSKILNLLKRKPLLAVGLAVGVYFLGVSKGWWVGIF
jgi:hypothetical protein